MAKQKWFWMTFGFWCLLGAATAWGLIHSPLHLGSKEISRFTARSNGAIQSNRISIVPASLKRSRDVITRQWEKEGWRCASGTLNLAPLLLGAPAKMNGLLSDLAEVRVFEKQDTQRILGLLKSPDQDKTYEWVVETPRDPSRPSSSSKVDFPLQPPPYASDILFLGSKNMETCQWTQPTAMNASDAFSRYYASLGYSGRLWHKRNGESVFLLHRGPVRLMAALQEGDEHTSVILTRIKKESR